jgi:hypothetical protein
MLRCKAKQLQALFFRRYIKPLSNNTLSLPGNRLPSRDGARSGNELARNVLRGDPVGMASLDATL